MSILSYDDFLNEMRNLKEINEGVHDPNIFKCVFLVGGAGSGKSFIAGKSGIGDGINIHGMKTINPDKEYEHMLKKAKLELAELEKWNDEEKSAYANMELDSEYIMSKKGQAVRDVSKEKTKKREELYIDGRLGLIIDGTGKDFDKLIKQKESLEAIGYECFMVAVNTERHVSIKRDSGRKRTLGADFVDEVWNKVQENLPKYKKVFGKNFIKIDNSVADAVMTTKLTSQITKEIAKFLKKPVDNPIAKKWMEMQLSKK